VIGAATLKGLDEDDDAWQGCTIILDGIVTETVPDRSTSRGTSSKRSAGGSGLTGSNSSRPRDEQVENDPGPGEGAGRAGASLERKRRSITRSWRRR